MKARTLIFIIMIMAVLLSLCLAAPVFAISDDSINSQHITEADGTSGQDTNSGSGIKTGHIQDGAVTDAKITGPISASKVQKPANVVVVARSGGDFTDPVSALDSITDASETNPYLVKIMPGVYDLGTNNLVVNPYVTLEGSGEGATNLLLLSGILTATDAEIRGLTLTVGECNYYGENATLKNVTVQGEGGYHLLITRGNNITFDRFSLNGGAGMYILGTGNKILNSRFDITPRATNWNYGIYVYSGDLEVKDSSIALTDSTSTTTVGIFMYSGNLELLNSNITLRGGWNNYGIFHYTGGATHVFSSTINVSQGQGLNMGVHTTTDAAKIDNSTITTSGTRSYSFGQYGGTIYVGASKLDSASLVNGQGGTLKCVNVYDGNYTPITCP